MTQNKAVIGLVNHRAQAEALVDSLIREGFSSSSISVLFPDASPRRDAVYEDGNNKAPEGAVMGIGAGGAIGGTLGLLAGIGALAIPGIGPFIAAGPILSALTGGAAVAALGGIVGALVGFGIPEKEARHFEGKIRSGNALISVHVETGSAKTLAKNVLERGGARDVVAVAEPASPAPREART